MQMSTEENILNTHPKGREILFRKRSFVYKEKKIFYYITEIGIVLSKKNNNFCYNVGCIRLNLKNLECS